MVYPKSRVALKLTSGGSRGGSSSGTEGGVEDLVTLVQR